MNTKDGLTSILVFKYLVIRITLVQNINILLKKIQNQTVSSVTQNRQIFLHQKSQVINYLRYLWAMLLYTAKKYCQKINFCCKYLKGSRVSSKALKAAFFTFTKYNT